VSSSQRHPRSGAALHGLIILALAAILLDCLVSGKEHFKTAFFEPPSPTVKCVYQITRDDYCLGTASLSGPATLSEILEAIGLTDEIEMRGNGEKVPCDKVIKFQANSSSYTLGKLAGAHLACAGRPIDINLADETDLLAVPGVGPRTAEKIVQHRDALGGFSTIEDLKKAPGITQKKFVAMAPFVAVNSSASFNRLQYVQAP